MVPVELRISTTLRWTIHPNDATDAERQALGQWVFALTLFYWSATQSEFLDIAKDVSLLDHARTLKKALCRKGSAGQEKVAFDEHFMKVRWKTEARIARFLKTVPQANLNVGWLHGLMVDCFTFWIADQAGLKAQYRWTTKQTSGPAAPGRQRIDRKAIIRRCECYLTLAFGENTQRQFARAHKVSRRIVDKDLKFCESLGLPAVKPLISYRHDLPSHSTK